MRLKRASFIGFSILLILLIIIAVTVYNFFGPGAKDIKASKAFMAKLNSINAISTEQDLNSINYKRVRTLSSQSELVHKTIVTQKFGIDLDKYNNIVGFAKKEIPMNTSKLDIQDARKIAENYLENICDGDVMIKSVKSDSDAEIMPYYTFIYTKAKNGYPFYFDEIRININKENGFLDGYSNSTMQRESKDPVINIKENDAEKIALENFEKYNKDGKVLDGTKLVYADNKSEDNPSSVCEVSYIVTIEGKDDSDKDIKWKILVNAEKGNIMNTLKDGVEKEVTTN